MQLTPQATADQLRQARRCLLETGEVPEGVVSLQVSLSWQRSQMAGLSPAEPPVAPPISSAADLRRALACEYDLLAHARPVMEFLYDQMRDSGSLVVLADSQGLLLHSLGDPDFVTRAERVSLAPGALWREEHRGTNAIGTAIANGCPTVIHGAEHYLERNSFLTCAASPVMAPDGRLRGVLDISVDQSGYHPHTFALVRSAARMIEDRLFHARHINDPLLRLHPHVEGLGSVGEGLLAVSEDGWIMGANAVAQHWLGLSASQIGAITLDRVFGPQAMRLQSLPATGQPTRVTTMQGQNLFVRDEPDRRRRVWAATPVSPNRARAASAASSAAAAAALAAARGRPPQAQDRRDDRRMAQALTRALRVQAQGIPVLLQGETGTGKEVFARTLHAEGDRASKPFVTVNCASLPEALLEAELFGYAGGAFPGARPEGAPGRIRQADGGTLFLDEIGELPPALQARLLRVMQDKQVVAVGACHAEPVDFVLACATHHPLRDAVTAGRFREDLYWRINGLTVQIPALRERGDTADLIDDMLASIALDMKRPEPPRITTEVVEALLQHPWPGNLRQLHAVLRTACALLGPHEDELHWEHFSEDLWYDVFSRPYRDDAPMAPRLDPGLPPPPSATAEEPGEVNLRRLSHTAIERAIQASNGNMSEAARKLGISRNTLYRRLKQVSE
ncbi:MAG: sigma-54-dependent Fis family transcriptional regulator [Aquabacterium sp.]